MAKAIAAGLMFLVTPAGVQQVEPVLPPQAVDQTYVPFLEANRAQRPLTLVAGDGFGRLTSNRATAYALLAFAMPADRPMLLLFEHDLRTTVRVRLLDRPPWDNPLVAQQLALEPRWIRGVSGRMIAGAWISLPPGMAGQQLYVLVEQNGGDGANLSPVVAELFDPELPLPFHSLARFWNSRSVEADLASPLERRQRLETQQIWQPGR